VHAGARDQAPVHEGADFRQLAVGEAGHGARAGIASTDVRRDPALDDVFAAVIRLAPDPVLDLDDVAEIKMVDADRHAGS